MKQYQKKFQGGTLAVTWNYLRESMSTYMSQPNPVTSRWEGEDHLRDSTFQLDAFRVSFALVLSSVALLCTPKLTCLFGFYIYCCSIGHLDCYIVLLCDFRSIPRLLVVLVHGIDV